MYPLKFKRYLIKKIWGGRKFQDILNIKLPDKNLYGESWEVSTHKQGISYIENGLFKGKSLLTLIEQYREAILGKEVIEKFQGKLPLLIKYLDINDKLSIQVHPDDEYALQVEGSLGKNECWYIMDADDDATIILGTKEGISKEDFKEKIKNNDFSDVFRTVKVKKGDFINIYPGTIHATLKGSFLIYEVNQNSDLTYRIYDFNRLVDGKLRELHINKALDVINFNSIPLISTIENRKKLFLTGAFKEELVRGKYFNVDKYTITHKFHDEINKNFKIYSIINGKGTITCNKKEYLVVKGDTYFIPAGLKITLKGNFEILKSFI